MSDQAEKLRRMALQMRQQIEAEMMRGIKRTRIIVVSSGKGGVGKTTLALNMALHLCRSNQRIVLMDADLGLANIDVMLGLVPKYTVQHLVQGRKSLKDIMLTGPHGLKIIPGGSGVNELANLSDAELKHIMVDLGKLDGDFDYMFIDTGAGISKNVISFTLAADDVVIVTTPEPTALTDAYGSVKTLAKHDFQGGLYLVVNQVADNTEGIMVGEKFRLVCQKFLDIDVKLLGGVMRDPLVGEGIRQQKALVELYPRSTAARNIAAIAGKLVNEDVSLAMMENRSSGIKRFFDKITRFMKE